MNCITDDIYGMVSDDDRAILKDRSADFELMRKIDQWKDVKPSDKIEDKADRESFSTGKFSDKMF